MTDPEQFQRDTLYRLAFGRASNILEPFRGFNDGRREPDPASVLAEVVGQLGDAPEVREGVEDACEGRRPRW
jgi:hypothetical protein